MKIVLAFSGGLDTSFCIPWLKENYDAEIHAVSVDCYGLSGKESEEVLNRARHLGANHATLIDGVQTMYDNVISYLIKGNVLRDRTYPLCVGVERYIQAELIAGYMKDHHINNVAHGSTGAGNDQIRFDSALQASAAELGDINIISPIRDKELTRKDTTRFLQKRGFEIPASTTNYSINKGIWGTTIGGKETTTSTEALPFEAFPQLGDPQNHQQAGEQVAITFENGLPTAINVEEFDPPELLQKAESIGVKHNIGLGMHTGDTILGIKGRIGFEAPAAELLYATHRELEKLVLSKWQRHLKDQLADTYGMMLHEAKFYDPAMRDIEAFFDNSQQDVTGTVTVYVCNGNIIPQFVESPNDALSEGQATYGEHQSGWTGVEARAFSKLYSIAANPIPKKSDQKEETVS